MSMSFHAKTISWLVLSSALLGTGLYAAFSAQRAMTFVKEQQARVEQTRKALAEGRQRAETYAALIERIGWRPGQALRHETIDTTATIAGHESDRLNELLHANHVGKGQFFLRSLSIETLPPTQALHDPMLKVSVKGDNILVLDRP